MKKEDVILTCYSVLKRETPLKFDCGKICNSRCCKGDEKTGMLLFPGEENLIDEDIKIINLENGKKLAVCNGMCNRHKRPLSCRMYPFFPLYNEKEDKIRIVFDYRADCPILTLGISKDYNKKFIKLLNRVGKVLLLNEETKNYYLDLCEEFYEFQKIVNMF